MASPHGDIRRRMISAKGRGMTLRRQTAVKPPVYRDVTLIGFERAYRPEQLSGDLRQGDAMVAICANEIQAAGWPAPPRPKDLLIIDGRTFAVQGAQTLSDGAEIVGYTLWVRGGL